MTDITAALANKIAEQVTDARAANREAGQAINALDVERAIQNGLRLRLVKCRTLSAELEDQLQGLLVDAHRELGPPALGVPEAAAKP